MIFFFRLFLLGLLNSDINYIFIDIDIDAKYKFKKVKLDQI